MILTVNNFLSQIVSEQKWPILRKMFKTCPNFLHMFPDTRVYQDDETIQYLSKRFTKELVAKVSIAVQYPVMVLSCCYITFYICSDKHIIRESKHIPRDSEEMLVYTMCVKKWVEGFSKN